VTPRIVRSPLHRVCALAVEDISVLRKSIVGKAATSGRSVERRCSSRSCFAVVIDAPLMGQSVLELLGTLEAAGEVVESTPHFGHHEMAGLGLDGGVSGIDIPRTTIWWK
jgi:hypothetical protein